MGRIEQKQLVIYEDSFTEVTRTTGLITLVETWTNSGKTIKVRDETVSRTMGQVDSIVLQRYDALGILRETETSTIVRISGIVSTITKVVS